MPLRCNSSVAQHGWSKGGLFSSQNNALIWMPDSHLILQRHLNLDSQYFGFPKTECFPNKFDEDRAQDRSMSVFPAFPLPFRRAYGTAAAASSQSVSKSHFHKTDLLFLFGCDSALARYHYCASLVRRSCNQGWRCFLFLHIESCTADDCCERSRNKIFASSCCSVCLSTGAGYGM